MQKIIIHASVEQLNNYVAKTWVESAAEAISKHGAFYVSLAGGSTPEKLYQLLASASYINSIDWNKVHIFFGDERCVPWDHEDSNYGMAMQALLAKVSIPQENIHGVNTQLNEPQACAEQYAETLSILPRNKDGLPSFDLMLLGMGDDGHTASLFPGTQALLEKSHWTRAVYVDKFSSWRISLTFPVINASKLVLFLVAGAAKAQTLAKVFAGQSADSVDYPVQQVKATNNTQVQWCLDESAAALLPDELKSTT